MLPIVALIGRPNVGKSTLFNRLTRSRAAIVADTPGVTRDRHYGRGWSGERPYLVVDTGGLAADSDQPMLRLMAEQAREAIAEADAVVLIVDVRQGLTPHDREIARLLRESGRPVWLAANKAEGMVREAAAAEFHELGLGEPHAISSAHGDGVAGLIEMVVDALPVASPPETSAERVRVAVVGRPNAGKSTLVNALIGASRMITSEEPGTTRDSIEVDFGRGGRSYTLVDTAGLRRRARVTEAVEKFSIVKTMQALESANVGVLVIDALAGATDQDAHIASYIEELGRAVVIVVNKWDAIHARARAGVRADVARRLRFLDFARTLCVSARNGAGLDALMAAVDEAHRAAFLKLATPRINRVLRAAVEAMEPPRRGLRRPKLRYAHQGGSNPPVVVVHGSGVDDLPQTYRRYLEKRIRAEFDLCGTPLRIDFRRADNPYDPAARRSGARR